MKAADSGACIRDKLRVIANLYCEELMELEEREGVQTELLT